jgi:hypothetical protein
MDAFATSLETTSILVIAGIMLCLMALVGFCANRLRVQQNRVRSKHDKAPIGIGGQEGYITSAVLGLLALMMGFTFALAVNRYETRRVLVISEANAIGTAYLRAQLLTEPHRTRISALLKDYTDHRIAFATVKRAQAQTMVAENDQLLTDLWTATVAAFPTIKGMPLSNSFIDSVNRVIDLHEERKSSRLAKVPTEVFAVLFVYIIVTSGALGYTTSGAAGLSEAAVLLGLILMSIMLTVDIDRPTGGNIVENQAPMLRLQASMANTPRSVYDRWTEKTAIVATN